MSLQVKNNGNWVAPSKIFAKQAGSWVEVKGAYIKKDGTWTQVYANTLPICADPTFATSVYLSNQYVTVLRRDLSCSTSGATIYYRSIQTVSPYTTGSWTSGSMFMTQMSPSVNTKWEIYASASGYQTSSIVFVAQS